MSLFVTGIGICVVSCVVVCCCGMLIVKLCCCYVSFCSQLSRLCDNDVNIEYQYCSSELERDYIADIMKGIWKKVIDRISVVVVGSG